MTINFEDRILMCFGELIAERRHREESQQNVEVHLTDHVINGKKCGYFLRWNTGGTLDILTTWDDVTAKMRIATLDMHQIRDFGRSLAMAVKIIILTVEEELEDRS